MADPTGRLATEAESELLRSLNDFGTSERLAALDKLRALIEKGERDTSLLDGRDHDPKPYEEALSLLDLLRAREERVVGR